MRIKNYTPVFDRITKELDPLASLVFGRIWRYAQMKNGYCEASLQTLATDTGLSVNTVRRRIDTLMQTDYISEKEYEIGTTRKLTPNYDVMIVGELIRIPEGDTPSTTVVPSPLPERDTKILIRDTSKDIFDATLELQGKQDVLAGYPVDVELYLREYIDISGDRPLVSEKAGWIKAARGWIELGVKLGEVREMYRYASEKWDIKRPGSITAAYRMMKTKQQAEDKAIESQWRAAK